MTDIFPLPMASGNEWDDISTAPQDGTLIQGLQNDKSGFKLFRCFWKNSRWRYLEWDSEVHPTHWRHNLPEHRKANRG